MSQDLYRGPIAKQNQATISIDASARRFQRHRSEKSMQTQQFIRDVEVVYRSTIRIALILSTFVGLALLYISPAGQSLFEHYLLSRESDKIVDGEAKGAIETDSDDPAKNSSGIEKLYQDLVTSCNEEDWDRALTIFEQFQEYDKTDYKDVILYGKRAIKETAKSIPVSDAETNLKLYQKLLDLDPQNSVYRKKVAFYSERTHGAVGTTSK
jgi:tetratricopeptide (TPR) repeat protein